MTEVNRGRTIDRRKGRDPVLKVLSSCGAATAVLAVIALVLLAKAKPHAFAHFDKEAFSVRSFWDPGYAQMLLGLMIVGLAIGLIGLVLNTRRLKRKNDSIRLNLVFLAVASAVGIAVYLYYWPL
jgi:ABC-type phosphate transport system permease subunit